MRRLIFSPNEQRGGGTGGGGGGGGEGRGGGAALPGFFFFSFFSVQQTTSEIGHCVKCFFGLATNALSVRNNNNNITAPPVSAILLVPCRVFVPTASVRNPFSTM